jgi:hypothetical protein
VYQFRGQRFFGQAGVLPFGGLDGGFGEPVGVVDVTVAQSGLQPLLIRRMAPGVR